ncbi:MAG: xanthine dehydrogenase family protein subunit M [bacterium]
MNQQPRYVIPQSIDEALQYLSEPIEHTMLLAGGTDAVVELRDSKIRPAPNDDPVTALNRIIDISRIPELKGIKEIGNELELGALVTHREMAESELIRQYGSILAEAATQMGSPQVRNRGTLGGNLGTASPAADTAPSLIALGAKVLLKSLQGKREIPIEDFFLAPGKTVLKSDELILGVRFPKMQSNEQGRYYKLGQRNAVSISIASVAIKAEIRNTRFGTVRIGLGSVAPKPIRALEAERSLFNQPFNAKIIEQAAQSAMTQCMTITDIRASGKYRCQIVEKVTQELLNDITLNPTK